MAFPYAVLGGLSILMGIMLFPPLLRFLSRPNIRFKLLGVCSGSSFSQDHIYIILCSYFFYFSWDQLQQRGRFKTEIQSSPLGGKLSRMLPDHTIDRLISETVSHARTLLSHYATTSPRDVHHLICFAVDLDVPNADLYRRERWGVPDPVSEQPSLESPSRSKSSFSGSRILDEKIAASLTKVEVNDHKIVSWKEESCAICWEKFEDIEDVFAIPCQHAFHKNCIVQWLQKSSMCPICRFKIPGM